MTGKQLKKRLKLTLLFLLLTPILGAILGAILGHGVSWVTTVTHDSANPRRKGSYEYIVTEEVLYYKEREPVYKIIIVFKEEE